MGFCGNLPILFVLAGLPVASALFAIGVARLQRLFLFDGPMLTVQAAGLGLWLFKGSREL